MPPKLWGFLLLVFYFSVLVSPVILRLREDHRRQAQRETQLEAFLDMLARIRALLAVRNTRA
jgi:Flp pilus assembly protein TadB